MSLQKEKTLTQSRVPFSLLQQINRGIKLMFIDGILSDDCSIFKFLRGLDLDLFLSKPRFNHLTAFLHHMTRESYDGKISNVKHRYRIFLGRFLKKN